MSDKQIEVWIGAFKIYFCLLFPIFISFMVYMKFLKRSHIAAKILVPILIYIVLVPALFILGIFSGLIPFSR